jgi:hypothetical protein
MRVKENWKRSVREKARGVNAERDGVEIVRLIYIYIGSWSWFCFAFSLFEYRYWPLSERKLARQEIEREQKETGF